MSARYVPSVPWGHCTRWFRLRSAAAAWCRPWHAARRLREMEESQRILVFTLARMIDDDGRPPLRLIPGGEENR